MESELSIENSIENLKEEKIKNISQDTNDNLLNENNKIRPKKDSDFNINYLELDDNHESRGLNKINGDMLLLNEKVRQKLEIIFQTMKNQKYIYIKVPYLIIALLINEIIYASVFNLFFFNVLGEYTNFIFSFMNLFFICIIAASLLKNYINNKNIILILSFIYFLLYVFIIIKSFYSNPWYFPFYLLFVAINFGVFIINFL